MATPTVTTRPAWAAGCSRLADAAHLGRVLLLWMAALLQLACAPPVRDWRTGETGNLPLQLVHGGPLVDRPSRVWIDTDAACNGGNADPDDCLAMLILLRSPEVEVVGVSTVFGNAPLPVVDQTTRELVRQMGGSTRLVYIGSSTALQAERTTPTEPAHAALERALERGPLTIVSLGPLTNIAATLRRRPDLADNIGLLVSVMGRRPGHLFHPAEGRTAQGILFGHGPVFRDFNFNQDRTAASVVLERVERISLVPYAVGRELMITRQDLARMARGPRASAWVAQRAEPWLRYWERDIGLPGFYPFDAFAALYVLHPRQFHCAKAVAWIAKDDQLPMPWRALFGSTGLLVGLQADQPQSTRALGAVVYCGGVGDGLKELLSGFLLQAN